MPKNFDFLTEVYPRVFTVEGNITSRLDRHTKAVRRRLEVVSTVLHLPLPPDEPSASDQLLWLLQQKHVDLDSRAAAVIIAASGSYPVESDHVLLSSWLRLDEFDEAWLIISRIVKRASHRALERRTTVVQGLIVDISRTSRASETTGIPRVSRALAANAQARGERRWGRSTNRPKSWLRVNSSGTTGWQVGTKTRSSGWQSPQD
jgi:hypothetical protein